MARNEETVTFNGVVYPIMDQAQSLRSITLRGQVPEAPGLHIKFSDILEGDYRITFRAPSYTRLILVKWTKAPWIKEEPVIIPIPKIKKPRKPRVKKVVPVPCE